MIKHRSIRLKSFVDTFGRNTPVHGVHQIVRCIECNVQPGTRNTLVHGRSLVEQPRTVSDRQSMTVTECTENYCADKI